MCRSKAKTVPQSPSIPVQLLLLASLEEPGMPDFIHKLQVGARYSSLNGPKVTARELKREVIDPAEAMAEKLMRKNWGLQQNFHSDNQHWKSLPQNEGAMQTSRLTVSPLIYEPGMNTGDCGGFLPPASFQTSPGAQANCC
jgi:hypothetical protein